MQGIIYTVFLLLFIVEAQGKIHVSENGKFLQTEDQQPFFGLGDTDWEMSHRLTREEIVFFIDTRSRQGFNVLQGVALAKFTGIRQLNRYGDYLLNNADPTQLLTTPGNNPDDEYEYDYWDHVDFALKRAARKDLYIGLLPTWGDKVSDLWGEGSVIFTPQNAEAYGHALALRYKTRTNILWILGGDRPATYTSKRTGQPVDDRALWRAMAKGIEDVLGTEAFITYHPWGNEYSTSQFIHSEPWLDMNSFQSGHGSRDARPWDWVTRDLALKPPKPTLDMEPCYEDHPVNPWDGKWTRQRGYFTDYDVRARIYRAIFAGGCGVTYGHHHVWQFMNTELYEPVNVGDTIIPWRQALHAKGAEEMQYVKKLMLSRPYFTRVPDQSLIMSNKGTDYTDIIMATRS